MMVPMLGRVLVVVMMMMLTLMFVISRSANLSTRAYSSSGDCTCLSHAVWISQNRRA